MKTNICLSFIVLNNFLQTSVKKNCASPTKSLTARHWSKIIVSESPRFEGSIEANSDPMQTIQKELERDISGVMQWGKWGKCV